MSDPGAASRLAGLSREEKTRLFEKLRRTGGAGGGGRGTGGAAAIPRLDPRPEPVPLTFAQARLWLIDRLDPGDPTYHIPTALRLRGALDRAAMAAALGAVAARHEALRTRFVVDASGLPAQVIEPPRPVPLPLVDLANLAAPRRAGEAERIFVAEARRPFSLARGPLWRATLARLAGESAAEPEHALMLNLHHIVSDGWSSSILVREAAASYVAASQPPGARAAAPSALPPLPIQMADFAVWQREHLSGEALARLLGYWRGQLAGAPAESPLPRDRERPVRPSGRGEQISFPAPPSLVRGVRALADQLGATPFMVLLAAWGLYAGRLAGRTDLVLGSAIANRNRAETAGLIGFFVNTLALRLDLSGEPTFRELVGRVRRVALDGYAHQDLPFERLVEELNPERSAGVTPLFQTMVSYLNTPVPVLAAAGLAIEPIEVPFAAAKFDLSIGFREVGERLDVTFEFATDLFDRATVEAWARAFVELAGRATAAPDLGVAALLGDAPLPEAARAGRAVGDAGGGARADRPEAVERPFEAPATAVERLVARLWSEVLGVDLARISRHASFFALGGHSLLAAQLATRIEQLLHVAVPLRDVFERPTVAELAIAIAAADLEPGRAERLAARDLGEARGAAAPAPAGAVDGAGSEPAADDGDRLVAVLPRPERPPLTFAQARLWLLDRLHPGDATYHVPAVVRLRGPLDPRAMAIALSRVVARHEVLRTRFVEGELEPYQAVAPPAERPRGLPEIDLAALPGERREAERDRALAGEARRPFALDRGPLLRAALVRLEGQEHALFVNVHHIAADAWSIAIVIRELAIVYAAWCEGREAELPALPVQVVDFALWQRRRLAGAELERQLDYWRAHLAGAPSELDLPIDRPRPERPSGRGRALSFALSREAADGLRTLAAAEGATPFMVVWAAWALFVGRQAGSRDVVVGAPLANRARPEVAGLIGFFVNTLALRLDLDGEAPAPSFRTLVGRARRVAVEGFAHGDVPFERVVEALNPERRLAVSPLFQTLVSVLDGGASLPPAGGLTLEPMTAPYGVAKFDLMAGFHIGPEGIGVTLESAVDLFEEVTADRLARALRGALERASAEPDAPADALVGLDEAERREVLGRWSGAAAPAESAGAAAAGDPFAPFVRTPGGPATPGLRLGRPAPGVRAYVLDDRLAPAPLGAVGELALGGRAVEDLGRLGPGAAERAAIAVVPDPFAPEPGARLVRTGRRVRFLATGPLAGELIAVDQPVAGEASSDPKHAEPPASDLERFVAGLWAEVLGVPLERIARGSNFFALGGHSLLGAQLATKIERSLEVPLPLRELFSAPTLSDLAAAIVAHDPQPGRAEKIARARLRLQAMSPAEREALRARGAS